jgi:ACS family glucarate transporter-like MFS transporter
MMPFDLLFHDPAGDLAARDPRVGRPTRVRYVVLGAACVLAVVTYIHRVGFATATTTLAAALHLDERQVGDLMAAFLVAYGLFEVPWGALSDRLGVRNPLALIVLGGSFTTGAIALVVLLPGGLAAQFGFLFLLRALFGMFQAGTFPAVSRMMADWMPTTERGRAQGLTWMSSRLGGAIAPLWLGGLIAMLGDWRWPLVIVAVLGLVWCAGFWPWFRNRPEEMSQVNAAERVLIIAGRGEKPAASHGPVPWSRMARSRSAWALCLMYGCLGYSGNFYLTMLPVYLHSHRHLSESTTHLLTSLPFACGIVACALGGFLSDGIIRWSGSRRWGRRLVGAGGLALAGLAIAAVPGTKDPRGLAFLLSLAFFGNDLAMGPAWAAAADLGERFAGTLGGMMNMLASFMAALGAKVAGHFFKQHEIVLPFLIFGVVYALGVFLWLGVDVTRTLTDQDRLEI